MAEFANNLAEVFAGGNHSPTADGMEPHRDCAVGQQRGGVLGNDTVRMVDTKGEIGFAVFGTAAVFAFGLAGGEFVRAQRMFRPEIA